MTEFMKPSAIEPGMNLLLCTRDAKLFRAWAREVRTTPFGVYLIAELDALYHPNVTTETVCLIDMDGSAYTSVVNKSTGRTGLGRREAA